MNTQEDAYLDLGDSTEVLALAVDNASRAFEGKSLDKMDPGDII